MPSAVGKSPSLSPDRILSSSPGGGRKLAADILPGLSLYPDSRGFSLPVTVSALASQKPASSSGKNQLLFSGLCQDPQEGPQTQ